MPFSSPDSVRQFGVEEYSYRCNTTPDNSNKKCSDEDCTVSSTATTIAISNVSKMEGGNDNAERRQAELRDLASALLQGYNNRDDRQYIIAQVIRSWHRGIFAPGNLEELQRRLDSSGSHFLSYKRMLSEVSIDEQEYFFSQLNYLDQQVVVGGSRESAPASDSDLSSRAGSGSAGSGDINRAVHHQQRSPRSTDGNTGGATALPTPPPPPPGNQNPPPGMPRNAGRGDLAGRDNA